MTEKSYFWHGSSDGDAILAPYTIDNIHEIIRNIFCSRPATEGVVKGYLNGLEVTNNNPGALDISINTGAAMVYGRFYENDAAITNLDVVAPVANTRWYTYFLTLDDAAQTIRVTSRYNDAVAANYPVGTQSALTWEIELARVSVTSGGVVTVTDRRSYWRMNGQQLPIHLAHQCLAGNQYAGGTSYMQFHALDIENGEYSIGTRYGPADDVGDCSVIHLDDADFIHHGNLESPICKFATPITTDPNIMATMGQYFTELYTLSWVDITGANHVSEIIGYLVMAYSRIVS